MRGGAEARVYHCRTYDGRHEIYLVVETDDQCALAHEAITSAEVADPDLTQFPWLRGQPGTILTEMAAVASGRHAYRRQDGVAVLPAVLLGP
jgi:hypothetical protein